MFFCLKPEFALHSKSDFTSVHSSLCPSTNERVVGNTSNIYYGQTPISDEKQQLSNPDAQIYYANIFDLEQIVFFFPLEGRCYIVTS